MSIAPESPTETRHPRWHHLWSVVRRGNEIMDSCPNAIVLSADDDLRRVIVAGLDELGCATYDAGSQAEALAYAARTPLDVVVFDAGRFDAIGCETIRQHRKK